MMEGDISLLKSVFEGVTALKQRSILSFCCLSILLTLAGCSSPKRSGAPAPPAVILRPGVTFSADPNPIDLDQSSVGKTTLSWQTPAKTVQIRLGASDGKLFTIAGGIGRSETGPWVSNGMTFFLQDATAPDPTASSATMAKLTVYVKSSS